jgi:catechol 1,2-dioxygenase
MMATTAAGDRLLSDVLATLAETRDPRLHQVLEALVRHLHAFVDEVGLTTEEWLAGIQFLTGVGQACTDTRQEFILLSDTLGVSSRVEMINYAGAADSTENTVLGPFYVPGSPARANGDSIVEGNDPGRRLYVSGVVRSLDGRPIAGATVDVWQTATKGLYAVQDASQSPTNLRGVFTTDADGRYAFVTVRPVDYSVPHDGPVGRLLEAAGRHPMRAAHVHLIVAAPGHHGVTTHIFDSESPYLSSDAVFGVRDSLVRVFQARPDGALSAEFDVTLTPRT